MTQHTTFFGLDVHADTIDATMVPPEGDKHTRWNQKHNPQAVTRLITKMRKLAKDTKIVCCYEAGPTGYELYRRFKKAGIECHVIAPSRIPVRAGERVKTDRRDSLKLARLLRAGELTAITPPTPEEEAIRDIFRGREQVRRALARKKQQLLAWLRHRALKYQSGKKFWTATHLTWLKKLEFDSPAEKFIFQQYIRDIELQLEQLKTFDSKIEEFAKAEPYAEAVNALKCFRGFDTLAAFCVVVELYAFERFSSPRALMAFLGLTPSEYSSGSKRRQGSITKTGNSYVRRMLVESSWHYKKKPYTGPTLRKRQKGQPTWITTIAEKAQSRLHRRFWKLLNRGKKSNLANIAIARELAGFIWSVLYPLATSEKKGAK